MRRFLYGVPQWGIRSRTVGTSTMAKEAKVDKVGTLRGVPESFKDHVGTSG